MGFLNAHDYTDAWRSWRELLLLPLLHGRPQAPMRLGLLLLLLLHDRPQPTSGRRAAKGKGKVARHPAPQPTTTGAAITSVEGNAARLESLARDGRLPVRYGATIVPGNGGLFDGPLQLEPCAGGWRCAKRRKGNKWELQARDGDTAFCDLAVVSADEFTAADFEAHYANKQPVVIRQSGSRGTPPFMSQAITDLFSRKGLLQGFGPHPASVGTSLEIVHKSGTGAIDMNIADFVNTMMPEGKTSQDFKGEPLYIFQRGVLGTDIVTPNVEGIFSPDATEVNIWMFGPPLSGTTFHFHASAFTGLAVGRKRWLLYPPTMTPPGGGSGPNAVPTYPITFWFSDVYPTLDAEHKPVECMQHPGDLIYIPEGWFHAVVNIDDVIGASFQNKSMVSEFHNLFQPTSGLEDRLKAKAMEPGRIDLTFFVAESLRKKGDLVAAAEEAKKVTDFDARISSAWCTRAMAAEQAGNLTQGEFTRGPPFQFGFEEPL